ncbi:T9SS type A sorting domain-containing protein [Algibacter sp. AS12]|uniref:T9SS type A sorting domain-containing protein n=1 Tax=Algibacter sp. AS12 TaxID=3135773 RepID=UPI00398BA41A
MKTKLLSLITIFIVLLGYSQNDILLVTDNDVDTVDNLTIYDSLLRTTYTNITLHNSNVTGSPTATDLIGIDLVIWFCGDDGFELNFWADGIGGNAVLKTYLDNGGKLWLIGSDVIYEYYGSAPDNFVAGEFMFDYAWLSSYNMQSYADDGGTGVPQANKTTSSGTSYPTPLTWIFSTLWYADGVSTKPETESIYEFGPETYPNAGETTMTFYENNTFSVMTTLFNSTSINTFGTTSNDLDAFNQAALDQIFDSSLSVNDEDLKNINYNIYPNPHNNHFNISLKNKSLINKDFKVYTILGNEVSGGKITSLNTEVSTVNLSKGTYFLKINETNYVQKIIKY